MRAGLTAVLALCLAAPATIVPVRAVAAQPPTADADRAKDLYNEGAKAYRVGKFDLAVAKFEEAYQLSGLPTILYNIGLAYTRRFDVSHDIGDLRQAKAVLQNFYIETQKDPELGDPAEIESQIKELDEKLARAEEQERAKQEAERKRQEELAKQGKAGPRTPQGPDPGKTLRLAGIGIAAGGGAIALTGVGLGAYFLVSGQRFSEELKNIRADCNGKCDPIEEPALYENEQVTIDNGRKANNLTIVGFAAMVGGGLAIAAGVGVPLLVIGSKRTKAWKRGEVVVLPVPGGVSLSGRF